MNSVKLQFLLKRDQRNSTARDAVARAAQALGLELTGTGAATVSARADPKAFESLFGMPPGEAASSSDETGSLPIPSEFGDLVESITPASDYIRFEDKN